jgi:hypothetical protein
VGGARSAWWLGPTDELLRQAIDVGELVAGDPRLLATALLGSLTALDRTVAINPDADELHAAQRVLGSLIDGVRTGWLPLVAGEPLLLHVLLGRLAVRFTLNEGACMAAVTGTPALVAYLYCSTNARRWPIFAAAVVEQTDVRALFAFPL